MFLEVKNLNKYYNSGNFFSKEKKQILKDVTFDVKEGEIFSIIGQSGAGKSTIGKILLGIEKKNSGDIMLMERPLEEMVKKEVQMVFQDPYSSLNPAMKIGKILEEPLKVNGVKDKKEREERVKSMLKEIGLEETWRKISI
jgi:ABC-type dipeptide/oligopeptide/nickel transport system ATPase subunit